MLCDSSSSHLGMVVGPSPLDGNPLVDPSGVSEAKNEAPPPSRPVPSQGSFLLGPGCKWEQVALEGLDKGTAASAQRPGSADGGQESHLYLGRDGAFRPLSTQSPDKNRGTSHPRRMCRERREEGLEQRNIELQPFRGILEGEKYEE